jgi:hypothetical protein
MWGPPPPHQTQHLKGAPGPHIFKKNPASEAGVFEKMWGLSRSPLAMGDLPLQKGFVYFLVVNCSQ